MATDWTKLRIEYVTSSITLRELAEKHGIKAAGVMRRAANEQWESVRKQESAKVIMASLSASVPERASELEKFNAEDLALANLIRAKARDMLDDAASPSDLKALSGAIDTAQKVGRLALGAATENTSVTTRELPASIDDFV